MDRGWRRMAVVAGLALGGVACGAAGGGPSGGDGGSGAGSGTGGTGGGPQLDAGGGGTGNDGCPPEARFIYLLSQQQGLFRFDPPTLALTPIGTVSCAPFLTAFSMAVDRSARAWVELTNGAIYWVDTATATCTPSGFAPHQAGFTTFGMGFSTNGPGVAAETLFVTDSSGATGAGNRGLGRIDASSLALVPIGAYDVPLGRGEMSGTGDGRLFAAFEGTPYVVAEIDKQTAHIIDQTPLSAVSATPGSSNFAFAFWGGDFWLFVGPGTRTDVYHHRVSDGTTTLVQSLAQVIVGAGVSTCAPTEPPE